VTQNSAREGEVLDIVMPGKGVLERRPGFRASEKELPERRSGAFCRKNTPAYILSQFR
jgi:hypothetical protein